MSSSVGESISLRAVGRSALILTSATVAVQVVGIGRELFVASQVGLSSRLDALLIALALPSSLVGFLTSGMVTALVPAYLAARETGGPDHARRLSGVILAWVALGGLVLALGLAGFSSLAVSIAGPGLSAVDRDSAMAFLFILSPLALIASVLAIMYSVCQAEQRFKAIAMSTLTGSLITLAIVLGAWGQLGLGAVAVASVAGPLVSLAILFGASVRGEFTPRLDLRPHGVGIRSFLHHAAPLTLGAGIGQINVIVDRAIGTLLAPGAVSALRFAEVLIRTPINAIGPAWSAAIYPTLVHVAQGREVGSLARVTDRVLRFSLAAFVPISILAVAVAPVAVSVAYGRGAFTAGDLALTTAVAVGFAPLIVEYMASPVIRLALNARRMGRILLIGAATNVVLNTFFDLVLGFALGVVGVALSSSLTAGAVAVYFARQLLKSDPEFRLRPIARSLFLSTVASLPGALPIAALSWSGAFPTDTVPALLALGASGIVGLAVYLAFATWLGLEEPRIVARVIVQPFLRLRPPRGAPR